MVGEYMTKLEALVDAIEQDDILYIEMESGTLPAKAIRINEEEAIIINQEAFTTDAERFGALAHEKGHCDTGAFYTEYAPLITRGQCERRAWRSAILEQLPFGELLQAFNACKTFDGISVYDVAEYLDLPQEFIERAVIEYLRLGEDFECDMSSVAF